MVNGNPLWVFDAELSITNSVLEEYHARFLRGKDLELSKDRTVAAAREFRKERAPAELIHGEFAEQILVPLITDGKYSHDFITVGICDKVLENPFLDNPYISERNEIDSEELAMFLTVRKSEDNFLSQHYEPKCKICTLLEGRPKHHRTVKSFHRYMPMSLAPLFDDLEKVRESLSNIQAQKLHLMRSIGEDQCIEDQWKTILSRKKSLNEKKEELKKQIVDTAVTLDRPFHMVLKRIKGDESLVDKFTYICVFDALDNKNVDLTGYKTRTVDDLFAFSVIGNLYGDGWEGTMAPGNLKQLSEDTKDGVDELEDIFRERGFLQEPSKARFFEKYRGFHMKLVYKGHFLEGQLMTWSDMEFNSQTHPAYKEAQKGIETLGASYGLPVQYLKEKIADIVDLRR
ncbi:hypothetical protein GOV11_02965 [Candidatus Woesearchaeota archaeon]|nr:hypothetical protein [Candidatus Woesearchaeota archaeon]